MASASLDGNKDIEGSSDIESNKVSAPDCGPAVVQETLLIRLSQEELVTIKRCTWLICRMEQARGPYDELGNDHPGTERRLQGAVRDLEEVLQFLVQRLGYTEVLAESSPLLELAERVVESLKPLEQVLEYRRATGRPHP